MDIIAQLESIARGIPVMDIREFFTRIEINKAREIMRKFPSHEHAKLIQEAIVDAKIEFINEKTNQQNDPKYIAYCLGKQTEA